MRLTKPYPSVTDRAEIYKQIALFLGDGVRMELALEDMAVIRRERGGTYLNKRADFLESLLDGLRSLGSFSIALENSGNPPETSLIKAGEEAGRLKETLESAARGLLAGQEMISAIRSSVTYPVILFFSLIGVLWFSAVFIAPKLETSVKGIVWTGQSALYFAVGHFVDGYGMLVIFGVLFLIGWLIRWSLPRWSEHGRMFADRLPPWSMYRLLHGVQFMSGLSTMMSAGIPMAQAVWKLSDNAPKYVRDRLDTILFHIRQGKTNFGEALHAAGQDFPDPEIVDTMRVYARMANFQKLLEESSDKWLEIAVQSARKQAKILNTMALVIAGIVMLWITYVTAVLIPMAINHFVMSHMGGAV
jgi:type II secretory pathway component PulF